ncbi:hypothetical protein ABZ901_18760, partial [Actinacidiphila alni]|uniref:2-oxoglutarate dehydrogenase E1 subunit family protein n=1 Tax=Actinacidiphila alni TaxID=380248 RepID=UPI003488454D
MSPQSPNSSSVSTDHQAQGEGPAAGFGPNEWLVDEIYQQYLQDRDSVDRAWWDFFADYKPDGSAESSAAPGEGGASGAAARAKAPAGGNGTISPQPGSATSGAAAPSDGGTAAARPTGGAPAAPPAAPGSTDSVNPAVRTRPVRKGSSRVSVLDEIIDGVRADLAE